MSDTTTCGHPLVGGGYCTQTVTASTVKCAAGHTPKNKAASTAADAATAATLHEQADPAGGPAATTADQQELDADIAALAADWKSIADLGPNVPVEDRYNALVDYAVGANHAVRSRVPDPEGFYCPTEDGAEVFWDAEAFKAATAEKLPGAEAALQAVATEAAAYLEGLSDAELDECAVANGRPHFTAAPRDKKILLLNPAIPLAAKHYYEARAAEAWVGAGNNRYGPKGYTESEALRAVLNDHIVTGPNGMQAHNPPRFSRLPAADLCKAAAALPAAHLSDRRRGGPTLRELVMLAEAHPKMQFSGEIIGPAHPKEGVRVNRVYISADMLQQPVFAEMAASPHAQTTEEGENVVRIAWE